MSEEQNRVQEDQKTLCHDLVGAGRSREILKLLFIGVVEMMEAWTSIQQRRAAGYESRRGGKGDCRVFGLSTGRCSCHLRRAEGRSRL